MLDAFISGFMCFVVGTSWATCQFVVGALLDIRCILETDGGGFVILKWMRL